ncbi:MAG: hypothetical protein WCV72_01780 [Patescibacteria group bacterium]|jgi:hypothetical protein
MSTPQKDPNEKAKKPSFWEKLSERSTTASGGGSLVDAIVRQAEKEANGSMGNNLREDNNEKKKALSLLANSRTLLTVTILVVLGIWIYFWTVLDSNNYLYGKLGRENITTELNRKTTLMQQAQADIRDLKKFNKLLQVENLANNVLTLDLESQILNYERPTGERVVPREDSTTVLLKTTNSAGEVVYLSEAEILGLEQERSGQLEKTRTLLQKIITQAISLENTISTGAKIEDSLNILVTEVTAINPDESNFPSAISKSHFAAAQAAATSILKNVKSMNLENLVTDIKKQVNLIDVSGLDKTASQVIADIKTILAKISPQQSSTFETAFDEIHELDLSKITDTNLYQEITRIIGDQRTNNSDSDLATAAVITNNMGRINAIGTLRANRIAWSAVIERAEKIVRLGSDLTRDTDGTPANANRDIDPNNTLVRLTNYSGKSSKGMIEISGSAYGKESYIARTFTLVADLIDALESSKYFRDVKGFAFSREESRDGGISSPINLQFSLQDLAVPDKRDTLVSGQTEISERTSNAASTTETMNQDDLQNLEFSFPEPQVTDTVTTSEPEPTNVFDALDTTINN